MQVIILLLSFSYTLLFISGLRTGLISLRKRNPPLKCYFYNEDYPSDCENITVNELHKPLYIVIWEKTEKAYNLIDEMEKQGLHTVFIPEDELDIMRLSDDSMPMVYKEDVLLESWMDIYAEMYPM